MGLLLLSWLIPVHYPPWLAFHGGALATASAFLMMVAALTRTRQFESSVSVAVLLVVVLGVVLRLLLGTMDHRPAIFLAEPVVLMVLWSVAALLVVVAEGATRQGEYALTRALLSTLVLGALVTALLIFRQWFGVVHAPWGIPSNWLLAPPPGSSAYGHLRQPNNAATLLSLGISALFIFFAQQRIRPLWLAISVLLLGLALALTGSRSGLLQLFVLWTVWLLWCRSELPKGHRLRPIMLASGFMVFWACVAWWGPSLRELVTQVPARDVLDLASSRARIEIWSTYLQAILQRPWHGYGPGSGGLAYWTIVAAENVSRLPGAAVATYGHSLPLDLAVWFGVPVAVGLLLTLIWPGVKVLFQHPQRLQLNWPSETLFLAGLSGAFFVHAMLELPHASPYLLFPVAWMFGVLAATVSSVRSTVRRAFLGVMLTLLIALSWAAARDYLQVEEGFRKIRTDINLVGVSDAHRTLSPWVFRAWPQWFGLATGAERGTPEQYLHATSFFAFDPLLFQAELQSGARAPLGELSWQQMRAILFRQTGYTAAPAERATLSQP